MRITHQHNIIPRFVIALAILLIAPACHTDFDTPDVSASQGCVEVAISCTQEGGSELRTTIDPDDMTSTRWCSGDQIYVWATTDGGATYPLAAQQFDLYYFSTSYSSATFTATITPLDTDTYTYYGAYPKPISVSGTEVTCTLTAEQSGAYDGANDVMQAYPLVSEALQSTTAISGALSFRHLTHAIRIRIPEDKNLLQDSVGMFVVTFPQEVVGNLTFDVTDTTTDPIFSNGSKVVTLDLETPVTEGDYVWLFVNPTYISGEISFDAYSKDGYRAATLTAQLDKQLEAGRVTPIALTVPTELSYTEVTLQITGNNLGEEVDSVTISAPSGAAFRTNEESITFLVNEANEYTIAYYSSLYGDVFASDGLTVTYHTKSVKKQVTLSLNNLVDGTLTTVVPYLIDEDFSGITSSSSLSAATSSIAGLDGWVAGEYSQWWAGYSVALRSRMSFYSVSDSRINSPLMSECGLREGATVAVQVIFNREWLKTKSSSMNLIVGRSSSTGIDDTISDSQTLALTSNSNASQTNIPTADTVSIAGVTETQLIAWKSNGDSGGFIFTSYYDYIYI